MKDESNKEDSESKLAIALDGTTKKKTKPTKPKKQRDANKKPTKKRTRITKTMSKDFKKHMNRSEIMEDPDLDKEIDFLSRTGLKNQVQTLQFSRLMGKFIKYSIFLEMLFN